MTVLDRHKCPKCKKGTSVKHCAKSRYCNWFVCTKCQPNNHLQVIFNPEGKFFVWSK